MTPIPRRISPEELARLPLRHYSGPTLVVQGEADLRCAQQDVGRERVIGFDTETPPSFHKGQSHLPAVVQVATRAAVYLFQLELMDFSATLRKWLESPSLIKAGVGLADDFKQLRRLFQFEERSSVDIGIVAQRHGLKQTGMQNLAGIFLGFRITKALRTSNWRRRKLSSAQIRYAATDAWVCRELFLRFEQLGWCRAEHRSVAQ